MKGHLGCSLSQLPLTTPDETQVRNILIKQFSLGLYFKISNIKAILPQPDYISNHKLALLNKKTWFSYLIIKDKPHTYPL